MLIRLYPLVFCPLKGCQRGSPHPITHKSKILLIKRTYELFSSDLTGGKMFNFDLLTEMKSLDLNDKRLNDRCIELIKAFERKPQESIPSACETHSEIKAAYRFFKNDKVSSEKILAPHIESTIQRCKNHSIVLDIEDTTEQDYTENSSLQNLNRLDHLNRQGMYCHCALAITPAGYPWGYCLRTFLIGKPRLLARNVIIDTHRLKIRKVIVG